MAEKAPSTFSYDARGEAAPVTSPAVQQPFASAFTAAVTPISEYVSMVSVPSLVRAVTVMKLPRFIASISCNSSVASPTKPLPSFA